jgi:hypothetical protein
MLCFTVHAETQICCLQSHSSADAPLRKKTLGDFAYTAVSSSSRLGNVDTFGGPRPASLIFSVSSLDTRKLGQDCEIESEGE